MEGICGIDSQLMGDGINDRGQGSNRIAREFTFFHELNFYLQWRTLDNVYFLTLNHAFTAIQNPSFHDFWAELWLNSVTNYDITHEPHEKNQSLRFIQLPTTNKEASFFSLIPEKIELQKSFTNQIIDNIHL